MGLDAVRNAVLGRARAEADAMLAEARKEADRKRADARAEDERLLAVALADARRRSEGVRAKELGQRRTEQRKALLAAKNRRIKETFAEARKRFLALPPAERMTVTLAWLGAEAADVGGVLRVNPDERDAFARQLDAVNKGRSQEARLTGVEGDPGVAGGVRIVGADFIADCTVDSRLANLQGEAVAAVAERLFGKGGT
jgi:vacuolar-type H+-ATPase subunit E/Vma4